MLSPFLDVIASLVSRLIGAMRFGESERIIKPFSQGLVKGAILCLRNLYFYFLHGESTSTASQLTSPAASQKSKDLNKVLLLLQDLAYT